MQKKYLEIERDKRIKPFFDNKIQTDLNCYWLYSIFYSSLVLKDENIYKDTLKSAQKLITKLKDNIYHCYNNDDEINVFLEDYSYLSLLLISMYELKMIPKL